MNKCSYCDKIINNKGSLKSHERCCNSNPDRIPWIRNVNRVYKKGFTPWNKGKKISNLEFWKNKYPNDEIFIENSTYARHSVKKRILDDDLIEYKCSICDIGPLWMNKPMPLILDHINGINNDNRLENLRFVCSNCDTQLPTYKSKNRGGSVKATNGT